MPKISVIVPLYNSSEFIGPCLAAIQKQEGMAPGEVEVIVVDDASTDKSADAAQGLCDKLIEMDENRGAAAARNRGAKEANAQLLAFIDADVIARPTALGLLCQEFEMDRQVSAAVGRYSRQPANDGLINAYHNVFTGYHHDLSPREIDWFWGALGAVRKEAFFSVGGFDERYQAASAEDMELGRALSEAGHKVVYCPEAEGAHAHHFTLKTMLINDYKKAILGTKLKLMGRLPRRAPGFANIGNIAFVPLLSSFIFLMALAAVTGNFLYVLIGLATTVGIYFAGRKYYHHLWKVFDSGFIWAVLLYWLQISVIMSGAVVGIIGHLVGRSVYGRPGWM